MIGVALLGCAETASPFEGDASAYDAPEDNTELPLACPDPVFDLFNNSETPSRGGEQTVEVGVDYAADFRCPACLSLATRLDEIWQRRSDFRARVRFYFHHFPLESIHPGTTEIHVAAAAVAKQGYEYFWTLHDEIFARTDEGESMLAGDVVDFAQSELGLDRSRLERDMHSDATKNFVQWDKEQCRGAGAAGTPTVFVCGERLASWSSLEAVVDGYLND